MLGPNAVSTPSPASSTARGDLDGRQILRQRALLERLARRLGRLLGRRAAVQQRGRLGREHLLGLVDLRALPSAASRAISSIGRVVKSLRKRPTSASSVLRQNCQ